MKTGKFLSLVILLSALCILLTPSAKAGSVDELCGTWGNPDYDDMSYMRAKYSLKSDGTWVNYVKTSDTTIYYRGTWTIKDKWTDSEGNIWYKVIKTYSTSTYYELWKLSSSGRIWEFCWGRKDYPTEIDSSRSAYRIHYRLDEIHGEFIASKVEDLVGIWETRFGGGVAYMQFEADETLNLASTAEMLKERATLILSGTFWFEGAVFHMKDNHVYGTGTYEVRVQKDEDKPIHLSFVVIDDPSRGRVADLTEGMARVEP